MVSARDRILAAGRWCVLLCLFSVPLNKPATNVFIGLALVCTLLGSRLGERLRTAIRQPIVIGSLAWLFMLFLAALYAPSGPARWEALSSYKAFAYPLLVAMLLEDKRWRDRGLFAFGLSVLLVLSASWTQYLIALFLGQDTELLKNDFAPFKNYTQQGIAVLIFAAMALVAAPHQAERRTRVALQVLCALAFLNVTLVLQSRTAYLIVIPLLIYLAWSTSTQMRFDWRRMGLALVALAIMATAALMTPRIQARVEQIKTDVVSYGQNKTATSTGIRFELWKRSASIVAAAPVFGHGLGQWATQYEARARDLIRSRFFQLKHPHQETLLILSEQGMFGLGVFILLLVLLLRHVRKLDYSHRIFFNSLVLIYVTAGLANCVLVDFAHRHVFLMLLACIPLIGPGETSAQTRPMKAQGA